VEDKNSASRFDRNLWQESEDFSFIGKGDLGGKAHGLEVLRSSLSTNLNWEFFKGISIKIPRLTVITNLKVFYFTLQDNTANAIDWDWLSRQNQLYEGEFIRHVHLQSELVIKTDGRKRLGVILR